MKIRNEAELHKLLRMSIAHFWDRQSAFEKEHGDEYTTRGVADLVGHIAGRYVAIECKMNKGYPSKEQVVWMKNICRTGGIGVYVICEFVDFEYVFYFVEANIDSLSYKYKSRWYTTKLVEREHNGEKFLLIDMMPLAAILLKRST